MTEPEKNNKRTIIYDGECNVCQSMVNKARVKLHNDEVRFLPSQELDRSGTDQNIDSKTLNRSVVYINDGVVYTGADAVIGIIKQMPGLWKFVGFILSIPGIKQLFALSYKVFARYRHSISNFIAENHPQRDP